MKFGTLKAIGHNLGHSVADGTGLMIGVYSTEIFAETASSPGGIIEVDFLTGEVTQGDASPELARALALYAQVLPDLCRRHGGDVTEFSRLTIRFSGNPMSQRFSVTVANRQGRTSTDHYEGIYGARLNS
jgi:hypothetical protein